MREARQPSHKQWAPGDLVLHETDPKTHAMLRRVVEVRDHRARTVYLDPKRLPRAHPAHEAAGPEGIWCPVELLHDPAIFLRTEEFLQTIRELSGREPDAIR